jgi:hypothetical protein
MFYRANQGGSHPRNTMLSLDKTARQIGAASADDRTGWEETRAGRYPGLERFSG